MNGVNYDKKNEGESNEAQNVCLQNFCAHGDSLKGVELVEQVLATRDDKRLSLHVMHGNVSLHRSIASCVRWVHHTQKRRTLAVRRPW